MLCLTFPQFFLNSKWNLLYVGQGLDIRWLNSSLIIFSVVEGASFIDILHLIPETLKLTRLGSIGVGDALNIEIDKQTQTIVDTVERVMAQRA